MDVKKDHDHDLLLEADDNPESQDGCRSLGKELGVDEATF